MISQHKTQETKGDIEITVKLSSICLIVSYLASFRGSRELYFKVVALRFLGRILALLGLVFQTWKSRY